jgi:hypothetical protein
MSHWRKQFVDDKTIGAHDLEVDGKFGTAIVKIKRFYQDTLVGSMGKEDKVFAELIGFKKPMIVNRTNFKRLEAFFNSFNMDDFLNKDVLLQVEKVKSPEGIVPALRFSSRPLPQKAANPPIADKDFPKAIAAIKNGSTTAETLKTTRSLTPEQIKQLDEI